MIVWWLFIMRNQLIMVDYFIKLQQLDPQNEEDHLAPITLLANNCQNNSNNNRVRGERNTKALFARMAKIVVFLIAIYIAAQMVASFLQRKNLILHLTYPVSTVGIPHIGQIFNFSAVQQHQKLEFESTMADLLQPYNATTCQLDSYGGIVLCSNIMNLSTAVLVFVGEDQSSDFYCQMYEKHEITSYVSVCKGSKVDSCQSKSVRQCLSEFSNRIFFTHYKPYNQTVGQFNLSSKHTIVKMRVLQNEWASFRSMPVVQLDLIDQLVLQINMQHAYLWGNLDTLNTILNRFYPVALHMHNSHCRQDRVIEHRLGRFQSDVFTVTLVNRNIIQLISNHRTFNTNARNHRYTPDVRDCQMPYPTLELEQSQVETVVIPWTDQNLHSLTLQHVHGRTVYSCPTVGMPLADTVFDLGKIQQNDRIEYYDFIAQLFKPYNDTSCEYARYGDKYDQGYVICRNMLNLSVALLNFGIEGRDTFGCQVSSQFNIPNLQYDCTSQKKPFCRHNNYRNHYYFACMSQRSQFIPTLNRTFYSMRDVIDRHKLNGRHIVVKMDIEGGEWASLRSLPLSYLDYIDQLIIQFHLFENPGYFKGNYIILQTLGELFYPVNLHQNNYNCWMHSRSKLRSSVFEVTLVNKRLLQLHSQSRSFTAHSLNQPNARHIGDCQIESA